MLDKLITLTKDKKTKMLNRREILQAIGASSILLAGTNYLSAAVNESPAWSIWHLKNNSFLLLNNTLHDEITDYQDNCVLFSHFDNQLWNMYDENNQFIIEIQDESYTSAILKFVNKFLQDKKHVMEISCNINDEVYILKEFITWTEHIKLIHSRLQFVKNTT